MGHGPDQELDAVDREMRNVPVAPCTCARSRDAWRTCPHEPHRTQTPPVPTVRERAVAVLRDARWAWLNVATDRNDEVAVVTLDALEAADLMVVDAAAFLAFTHAETMARMTPTRSGLFDEIRGERARQDTKWGGPEHDDTHGPHDWISMIAIHAGSALGKNGFSLLRWHHGMVKVAALAVAAIESATRVVERNEAPLHRAIDREVASSLREDPRENGHCPHCGYTRIHAAGCPCEPTEPLDAGDL